MEPAEHGGKGTCGYHCALAYINRLRKEEHTLNGMKKKIAEWLQQEETIDGSKDGQKTKKPQNIWKTGHRSRVHKNS